MKKSFTISILIWLGALMVGTSCSTSSVVTYDYLRPAEVTLPVELGSMGIVNHVPDSLYELSSKVTQVLAEDVSDAQYFNDIHLLDSVITEPMTPTHVEDLAYFLDVDFLATLDTLELSLKRHSTQNLEGEYEAIAQIEVLARLRLYLPGRAHAFSNLVIKDTLDWHGYALDEQEAFGYLPKIANMAKEATTYVGETLADKIAPHWTTVTRALYVRESGELKEAAVFVHDNEWNAAQAIWDKTYKMTNSTKLKGYCAYNLAVYYEKISEVDTAIDWLTTSAAHFKEVKNHKALQDAALYLIFLKRRQTELQLLDLQFAE